MAIFDVLNYPPPYCLNMCSGSAAVTLSCKKAKLPPHHSLRSFCNLTKEAANNSQSTTTSCCPQGYKSLTYREHLLLTIWAGCSGSLSALTATQCSTAEHTHYTLQQGKRHHLTACTCMLLFHNSHNQQQKSCFDHSQWSTNGLISIFFMLFFQTPNWAGQDSGF